MLKSGPAETEWLVEPDGNTGDRVECGTRPAHNESSLTKQAEWSEGIPPGRGRLKFPSEIDRPDDRALQLSRLMRT
jgi:hypothetical protein